MTREDWSLRNFKKYCTIVPPPSAWCPAGVRLVFPRHDSDLEGVWLLKNSTKTLTREDWSLRNFLKVLYDKSMYLYGNSSRYFT
jgi:hypothetical protein